MTDNTTKIWEKHFGDTPSVNLNNPAIEGFFDELTQDCLNEDKTAAKKICKGCNHELPLRFFEGESPTCYIC